MKSSQSPESGDRPGTSAGGQSPSADMVARGCSHRGVGNDPTQGMQKGEERCQRQVGIQDQKCPVMPGFKNYD